MDTSDRAGAAPSAPNPLFRLAHVAEPRCLHPGEKAVLHTRLDVLEDVPGFVLRTGVPNEIAADDYRALAGGEACQPRFEVYGGELNRAVDLVWRCDSPARRGQRFEFQLEATANPIEQDAEAVSGARVFAGDLGVREACSEWAALLIRAKGRYLAHLPSIYRDDELMGRYLMLFESFWQPIDCQISSLHYYFDPRTTPADLLPWLATWVDLALDERWPVAKRRDLLRSAVSLYRRRGTPGGLCDYLELYTGGQAAVVEHRARNFRLGPDARLGLGVALGARNEPHTFEVRLELPPDTAGRPHRDQERRQVIESIIESCKPAHTRYTLEVVPHAD